MNLTVCLLAMLVVSSPAPEITGTIVDHSGKPISKIGVAVVAIDSDQVIKKTLSDSDGSFDFAGLTSGGYALVAKTDSACALSDPIQVDSGFTAVVRLRLINGLCQNPVRFAKPPLDV